MTGFHLTELLELPYFYHAHNCGFPGSPQTERVVELALADYWLGRAGGDVWEIGAVTPYYWPGRVVHVIDPSDSHKLVTGRLSMFAYDFTGANVLSISTIEHIGTGEYITESGVDPVCALWKLLIESDKMLVTYPAGQHQGLDQVVHDGNVDQFCNLCFLIRDDGGEVWTPAPKETAWRQYGHWANSVAILEKGDIFK